jgi:hypothetical protein
VANSYQVNATQLTPNTTVHIKGKLTYSRLAKLVEGEDLARVDQQRIANGMQPIGRAHTSVNLSEAEVQFADPANPTKEEIFVQERRFISAKHPEHGQSYSMDNKSMNLPIVAVQNAAGEAEQLILEGDLAAGLEVTLVLRVYKPKGFPNCGLSLDLVLLHEKPRYYNAGVNTGELAARGIIFATPPKQVSGTDAAAAAPAAAVSAAAFPAGTDPNTGLPAPAPAVAAVPATPPVMQPAPVAAVAPAPVAAVAPAVQQFETPEQELARLRNAEAARQAAAAGSGGESAFGSPWVDPQAPVAAAQGIAYSG